ncbi:MAG: hypothetical protein BWX64_02215 [Acidobacteria bacterium ADurb.Bin051]|nr:MAG: hypothetical protein BWX64_02215 [Acidobacteria bacterium ADurb.Bin051]
MGRPAGDQQHLQWGRHRRDGHDAVVVLPGGAAQHELVGLPGHLYLQRGGGDGRRPRSRRRHRRRQPGAHDPLLGRQRRGGCEHREAPRDGEERPHGGSHAERPVRLVRAESTRRSEHRHDHRILQPRPESGAGEAGRGGGRHRPPLGRFARLHERSRGSLRRGMGSAVDRYLLPSDGGHLDVDRAHRRCRRGLLRVLPHQLLRRPVAGAREGSAHQRRGGHRPRLPLLRAGVGTDQPAAVDRGPADRTDRAPRPVVLPSAHHRPLLHADAAGRRQLDPPQDHPRLDRPAGDSGEQLAVAQRPRPDRHLPRGGDLPGQPVHRRLVHSQPRHGQGQRQQRGERLRADAHDGRLDDRGASCERRGEPAAPHRAGFRARRLGRPAAVHAAPGSDRARGQRDRRQPDRSLLARGHGRHRVPPLPERERRRAVRAARHRAGAGDRLHRHPGLRRHDLLLRRPELRQQRLRLRVGRFERGVGHRDGRLPPAAALRRPRLGERPRRRPGLRPAPRLEPGDSAVRGTGDLRGLPLPDPRLHPRAGEPDRRLPERYRLGRHHDAARHRPLLRRPRRGRRRRGERSVQRRQRGRQRRGAVGLRQRHSAQRHGLRPRLRERAGRSVLRLGRPGLRRYRSPMAGPAELQWQHLPLRRRWLQR